MNDTVALMEARLREAFQTTHLVIHDDSDEHIGHAGAADGAGHYRLEIAAPAFDNCSRIESHRLIYDALQAYMGDRIHALSIQHLPTSRGLSAGSSYFNKLLAWIPRIKRGT